MNTFDQPAETSREISVVSHPTPAKPLPRSSYAGVPYGIEADETDSDGGFVDYWRVLRRNTRTICLAAFAGLVLGFLIGIPMRPVYRAHTSLEVLTINQDFMNMKQANPTTTNDNNYDTSEEQTQAKLLESAALQKRVMLALDPSGSLTSLTKPEMAATGWRSWLHLREPAKLTSRQRLILAAAKTLKVRPTSKTRVLEVTVDSTDARLAADFANSLTKEFIAMTLEARWGTVQQTSDWLHKELDDARDKLRHSEDSLQVYARDSGLIFTDESTNVATEKLQLLQQQLSLATSDRITKQSRFELAQNSPPDSLADVLNDASLRETQAKITDLERQIADLGTVFNAEYPKIKRLQAEVDSLRVAFDRSRTDILSRIKNDYQEANRREKLLAAAYDTQAHEVSGQDEKAIQYNILKRDVDSNRQLYDTMLQQMKQSSIASAMRASNVRVVDPADLPDEAVFPNFKLNSAIGLLAGLLFSVMAVTIRERADRTLHRPGDLKLWTNLAEVGIIPRSDQASIQPSHGLALSGNTLKNGYQAPAGSIELVTFQKKPSLIAEAFRSALTSVLFMSNNSISGRPRVLVFTSANPADGKTTVASNFAIAAAEIRCKVLVIDADMRRPRMHQVFNVSNERGLSDLLQGELDFELATELIRKTEIPNLHLLPSGPIAHSAAHLLYSPSLAALLSRFREEYDMILIDTPPMLQITDARVIGRVADAVMLVARAGQTTRDALTAAKSRLEEDQTKVLGAILNDWNPKQAPGGYYGHYSGSYYERYETAASK